MENFSCMSIVMQLTQAMNEAIEADKIKINNPRKRKDGNASWAAAGYYFSRLTGNEQLSAEDMRKLYIDYRSKR